MNQRFKPDQRTLQLMDLFRQMTNECVRVGLAEGKTSLKSLSLACYPKLKKHQIPAAYKLSAISNAAGILKNYRKLSKKHHVKAPYCRRSKLATCYGLKVSAGNLRMPGDLQLPLNVYVQRFLSQLGVEVRSVNLTPESFSISVRKQVEPVECRGMLGIDRNLDNITIADTENRIERHDLSKATAVKSRCRQTKRRFRRNDVKVRRKIYSKYGQLERGRVDWLLHNVSSNIVLQAKLRRQAIVMEDLRGIRRLYRKGNGQGATYRWRMNSWSYAELQRQIQYKAAWNGIPVTYVMSHGTSAKCSMCGHHVLPEENRQLHCPNCGLTIDRDVNAARNILARGLRLYCVSVWNNPAFRELSQVLYQYNSLVFIFCCRESFKNHISVFGQTEPNLGLSHLDYPQNFLPIPEVQAYNKWSWVHDFTVAYLISQMLQRFLFRDMQLNRNAWSNSITLFVVLSFLKHDADKSLSIYESCEIIPVHVEACIQALYLMFKPVGSAGEAMVRKPTKRVVILKVDADQSTQRLTK